MDEIAIISKKLQTHEGIVLSNFAEVQVIEKKLFLYKEKPVIIYIRDQMARDNARIYKYKYHLCSCKTIEEMQRSKRFYKFVVSTRSDEMFLINIIDSNTSKRIEGPIIEKLNVCKNCLLELNYKGYKSHHFDKKIYQSFSLAEFFQEYSTEFKQTPRYTDKDAPLNEYSKNFEQLSYSYRASNQWICDLCEINLENDKEFLDTHHKNGLKWDDTLANLRCLCVRCHAEQPGHEHMKYSEKYKLFMEKYGQKV